MSGIRLAQVTDESRQRVKGADQIGAQAIVEVRLAHAVQGAEANVADAMGQRGGQHLVRLGHLENLPGASHRRAIGHHLQVLVAKGFRQVVGLAAAHDQLPTLGGKATNHGAPDTAGGAGDQHDLARHPPGGRGRGHRLPVALGFPVLDEAALGGVQDREQAVHWASPTLRRAYLAADKISIASRQASSMSGPRRAKTWNSAINRASRSIS